VASTFDLLPNQCAFFGENLRRRQLRLRTANRDEKKPTWQPGAFCELDGEKERGKRGGGGDSVPSRSALKTVDRRVGGGGGGWGWGGGGGGGFLGGGGGGLCVGGGGGGGGGMSFSFSSAKKPRVQVRGGATFLKLILGRGVLNFLMLFGGGRGPLHAYPIGLRGKGGKEEGWLLDSSGNVKSLSRLKGGKEEELCHFSDRQMAFMLQSKGGKRGKKKKGVSGCSSGCVRS